VQQRLKKNLEAARGWTIQLRRELHKIPELAQEEEKTAALVAKTLGELGFTPQTGVGKHGVVATLDTGRPGPVVMFRADMDALPIQEESGLPFASTHQGAAHCCGHDCHTAMLLGTAKVLSEAKDKLSGVVRFVFQPAEEAVSGARPMIAEGIMDSPKVDYCFGMHVWPAVPKGQVGIKSGDLMAAMSWFDLEIIGKGGHGAMPHLCVDALEVGTQVVSALQRITSRQMNPMQPTVVTIGEFHAGTAMNIIPDRAELHGTTRTFDKEVWRTWDKRLRSVIAGVCASMGADFKLEFHQGVPPVSNDPQATDIVRKAALTLLGADRIIEPEPTMGGEDMSLFLEQAKGAFVFLGAQMEDGFPLHNPKIVFPEDILATGVALNCQIAWDLLT